VSVSCDRCPASCCRLTVVLGADDVVAAELLQQVGSGPPRMRHGADGACIALDRHSSRCTIYETRPAACRRFTMDGAYCRSVRRADRMRIDSESLPLMAV
jgi:Fe-S-cluster containining protein